MENFSYNDLSYINKRKKKIVEKNIIFKIKEAKNRRENRH